MLVGNLQISEPFRNGPLGANASGTFSVAAGAVLDLATNGSTVAYSGVFRGTGSGTVRLASGTVQIGALGATFDFPQSMFQWSGGTIAAGSEGLNNTGTISLLGAATKTLSGKLINVGTITHGDTGPLFFQPVGQEGAQIVNKAGALYELRGDQQFAQSSERTRSSMQERYENLPVQALVATRHCNFRISQERSMYAVVLLCFQKVLGLRIQEASSWFPPALCWTFVAATIS